MQAEKQLNTFESIHPSYEFQRYYDDATTWLAEALDGNMRTTFQYHFHDGELFARDGRPLSPIFSNAVEDARRKALSNPLLDFEVRRRIIEEDEYADILLMATGKGPNTMVVVSDCPPEVMNSKASIGGYDAERKQTMLRVITRSEEGLIDITSQSLDGSNREALEAIYDELDERALSGELLGQRIKKELTPEEQNNLVDRLMAAHDNKLSELLGGSWYGGRQTSRYKNTYDFVCQQTDLTDLVVRSQIEAQDGRFKVTEMLYKVVATMESRWLGNKHFGFNGNRNNLYHEMISAAQEAAARGKVYRGCGLEIEASEELTELGYGNKREDSEEGKCVTCPFCEETVDALITKTHISCPKCKKSVRKQ